MVLYKGAGENTVAVAEGIREELEKLNRELPGGKLVVLFDSSEYVREALTSVVCAGIVGGFLALGVLFLFLGSLRAVLVVGTAVPLSVAACFLLLGMGGFSLNIMSLGGLALGLGMLVDNAVVVLENIYRKRNIYEDPSRGAIEGTREVVFPVLGGTLTTGVVFLPLFFFRGISGILFRELGMVVILSLFASLGVALTLVPMLSRFLVSSVRNLEVPFRMFQAFSEEYERLLALLFSRPLKGSLLFCGFLGAALLLLPYIGSELVPPTDESELRVYFSMEQGTPLEVREVVMCHMEKIMEAEIPEIQVLQCAADDTSDGGVFRLRLAPRKERRRDVREIAEELHRLLQRIPGIQGRVRVPSSILGNLLGDNGEQAVSVEIRGFEPEVARTLGKEVLRRAERVSGVNDATLPEERGIPEYLLLVDREKASALGTETGEIARTVRLFLSGGNAGEFYRGEDSFPIRVQGEGSEKWSLDELLRLSFTVSSDRVFKLANLAEEGVDRAPLSISRKDRQRLLSLSVSAPSRPPGDLVEDLREALQGLPLPEGYSLAFRGLLGRAGPIFQRALSKHPSGPAAGLYDLGMPIRIPGRTFSGSSFGTSGFSGSGGHAFSYGYHLEPAVPYGVSYSYGHRGEQLPFVDLPGGGVRKTSRFFPGGGGSEGRPGKIAPYSHDLLQHGNRPSSPGFRLGRGNAGSSGPGGYRRTSYLYREYPLSASSSLCPDAKVFFSQEWPVGERAEITRSFTLLYGACVLSGQKKFYAIPRPKKGFGFSVGRWNETDFEKEGDPGWERKRYCLRGSLRWLFSDGSSTITLIKKAWKGLCKNPLLGPWPWRWHLSKDGISGSGGSLREPSNLRFSSIWLPG